MTVNDKLAPATLQRPGAVAHGGMNSMSRRKATQPRRVSVERNIYRRPDGKLEVGYRDSTGNQRWQVVQGGIMAARAVRDSILGAKGEGKLVQPNPRLTFGDAADRWLVEQVSDLKPATRAIYRNAIENHLKPRWERRRMDTITVDDAARLVRELRFEGKAEWTIAGILKAANRVFAFALRRCAWHGQNPITLLERGERPRTGQTPRRRIFRGEELGATIQAAYEPYRTLLKLASVTGARLSELLGLVWADVDLRDCAAASVSFEFQVDRKGNRHSLKTQESRRIVEIPRQLAVVLLEHRARSPHSKTDSFVFSTRSGRPLGQRNVLRELRRAMKSALDSSGRPMFPVLHEPGPAPRGAVPNFHSLRHTAASEAIAQGDGAEEVSWQLGHKNSNVTRAIYVQEIKNAERRARRRDRMELRYSALLGEVSADRVAPRSADPRQAIVPLYG